MNVPSGKTIIKLRNDIAQSSCKKGDVGYIDGYVWNGDLPFAVFVSIGRPFELVRIYDVEVDRTVGT